MQKSTAAQHPIVAGQLRKPPKYCSWCVSSYARAAKPAALGRVTPRVLPVEALVEGVSTPSEIPDSRVNVGRDA